LGSAPLWPGAIGPGGALRILSPSGREEGTLEHLREVVPEWHRPVAGLLGTHVPWIADDADHLVFASTGVAFAVIALHGSMLLVALRAGGARGAPGALLALVALTILVFPLPLRSGPSAIRFLTPAYLPLVAVVSWAAVRRGSTRRAVIFVLTLGVLNLAVTARLLQAWRGADRAGAPFYLPDVGPLRAALESRGIRRAYASYGLAYRLTFESGERLVVSQPWNERFLHHPLPYLDEVRFARKVAWLLLPGAPTDLPAPRAFEDLLNAAGGRWDRLDAGPVVAYHAFAPPFGPVVTSMAGGTGARTWTLDPARALDAVTLMAGPSGPRLPRSMDVEVSGDGTTFERVVRRRRREERRDLRWVNGHPQYVTDDDCVAAPLAGRTIAAVRITPVDGEPGVVAQLLLHPATNPVESAAFWDEWLDPGLSWAERRRVLDERARTERADWYYRRLLAARHR
jgi:hypothetical protein